MENQSVIRRNDEPETETLPNGHAPNRLRYDGCSGADRCLVVVLVFAEDVHTYQRTRIYLLLVDYIAVHGDGVAIFYGPQEFEVDRPRMIKNVGAEKLPQAFRSESH